MSSTLRVLNRSSRRRLLHRCSRSYLAHNSSMYSLLFLGAPQQGALQSILRNNSKQFQKRQFCFHAYLLKGFDLFEKNEKPKGDDQKSKEKNETKKNQKESHNQENDEPKDSQQVNKEELKEKDKVKHSGFELFSTEKAKNKENVKESNKQNLSNKQDIKGSEKEKHNGKEKQSEKEEKEENAEKKKKKEKNQEEEEEEEGGQFPKIEDMIKKEQQNWKRFLPAIAVLIAFAVWDAYRHSLRVESWEQLLNDVKDRNIEKIIVREKMTEVYPKGGNDVQAYKVAFGGEAMERRLSELRHEMELSESQFEEIAPIYYSSRVPTSREEVFTYIAIFGSGLIFFFMLQRAAKGAMGTSFIGRSSKKIQENVKTRFSDVAGLDEAKQEITEFVDFLKKPEKFNKIGARIPKGALLVGPPGTGKTLLAKAVAGEAGVPFFSMSGSEFVEMVIGVGPARVRSLFSEAKKNAPSIVFIDEIDAVGRKRGSGKFLGRNDERENTLNQLLVEMDGFSSRTGVVVLAATNRPEILDGALLRPGRFDRQVEISNPDIKGREQIFHVHMKKITLSRPIEEYAPRLAALTPGFSGADIANVCNEAALIASRSDSEAINLNHFEDAIDKIIGGLEKKNKPLSQEEKNIVAHHEAGHAVTGWFLENADPLLKVSIVPRGSGALGYAQYLPKERFIMKYDELFDYMCLALGGRAAEQIMFNHLSTGASDDLRKVTQMAYSMVAEYGMSPDVGHISFPMNQDVLNVEKPYSESTGRLIDAEVRKLTQMAYDRTLSLLKQHKDGLIGIAKILLEKEKISAEDMIAVLGDRPSGISGSFEKYLQSLQETFKEKQEAKSQAETESSSTNSNNNNNNNDDDDDDNNNNNIRENKNDSSKVSPPDTPQN